MPLLKIFKPAKKEAQRDANRLGIQARKVNYLPSKQLE
jgi:hypothetical protein